MTILSINFIYSLYFYSCINMSRAFIIKAGQMLKFDMSLLKYNEFWTNFMISGNWLITFIFSINILYFLKMTAKNNDSCYIPQWLLNMSNRLPNWMNKETISKKNFDISISRKGFVCKKGSLSKLFNASFSHYNLIHLITNMYYLTTWLGPSLINSVGPFWFTVIYCSSGIGAGIIHTKILPDDEALGASGSLSGLYGAINFLNNVSAIAFIAWMIFITLFTQLINKYYLSIKIGAYGHLGGALVGYYTIMLLKLIIVSI